MVALWVPPEVAMQLAVDGGESPADLHVTLVYLGHREAVSDEALNAVRGVVEAAAAIEPLVGVVSGIGRFVGGEQDVIYASVDVPGLSALRESLAGALAACGIAVPKDHGFDPHITLAYVAPGAASQADLAAPIPITLADLVVAAGGERASWRCGAANTASEGVQRFAPQPEVRVSPEFRVDADGPCTVRGPVYPSFDPTPGASYTVADLNTLVDSWGTFITSADLRKLKDDYMIRSQLVDRMHDNEVVAGRVVDAVMRGPDGDFPTPTWYGGVRVDDAYAGEVRAGKLRGFSIEVFAFRERIEVVARGDGEVPDLTGVDRPPYYPRMVRVQGERRISIDRLTALRPIAKSLVDRPAIRQEFAITRSEPVCRFTEEEVVPEPVVVTDPAAAEAASESRAAELPAEPPSWWGGLVDRIAAALRRDPVALNADGTPPPVV